MGEFTKGPWSVSGDSVIAEAPGHAGDVVCNAPEPELFVSYSKWEANAPLIAAAPELYDALRRLLGLYVADEGDPTVPEFEDARHALALAEGRGGEDG